MFRHYGYFTPQDDKSRQQNSAVVQHHSMYHSHWIQCGDVQPTNLFISLSFSFECFEIDCMLSLKSL